MEPLFKMGDRVRLTERGLHLATRRWAKLDWPNRRGRIVHLTRRSEAYVLWDGRKSIDVVPFVILEKADPSKGAAPTGEGAPGDQRPALSKEE